VDRFERTGANQNIDPDYVEMVRGISEDLLGRCDDAQEENEPILIHPTPDACVMIKPMLFWGDTFYPNGGWKDFRGFFDSVDEAKEFSEKNLSCYMWAHIVENGKITWKFECDDWKEGSLEWEQVVDG